MKHTKTLPFALQLQRFADAGSVVNTTGGTVNAYTGAATEGMTAAMKTYYDTELLENARDEAVYGQLGKPQVLPAGHGKSVEWRKWNTLPDPDKLQEGVIPDGKKFGQSTMNVAIAQYGEYVSVSDQLQLHAVDDTILGAAEEVGAAMGRKADKLTRDAILAGSTNVMFAPAVNRTSGETGATPVTVYSVTASDEAFCGFTPDLVARAVTRLKKQNAPTINGKYVAVIHPSVAYDLRKSPEWINYHQYDATTEIFTGEIGELHGVRFIESNMAPVMAGAPLYSESQRYLTLSAAAADTAGNSIEGGWGVSGAFAWTVTEDLAGEGCTADLEQLVGQYVLISDGGVITDRLRVSGVDPAAKKIYTETAPSAGSFTVSAGSDYLLPGNGGAESKDGNCQVAVYATMFFGRDAFGVVAPEGAGMEMIIKTSDQAGGPLNQFGTVGGKMSHAARVLYPERMVTVYSASTYSGDDEPNWQL